MNYFLTDKQLDTLAQMSVLRSGTQDGKKGKLWLTGVNECTLADAMCSNAKNGLFISCLNEQILPSQLAALTVQVSGKG